MRKDGDYVHKGLKSGKVSRNAHKIVVAERVVLNFVQRMSGIATLTKILFYSFSTNWYGYMHVTLVMIKMSYLEKDLLVY